METRTIGSLTEIYITGGGNFVTQAYPTNFHTFHTRKGLVVGEKPGDFMEVTAAERAAIEAQDAKWEQPDHTLVYLAEMNGAAYNRATGFFELNGLTDITAPQMDEIVKAGEVHGVTMNLYSDKDKIRTTFPINWVRCQNGADFSGMFQSCYLLESIVFDCAIGGCNKLYYTFNCSNLISITGFIIDNLNSSDTTSFACPKLETLEMKIKNAYKSVSIDISRCPLIKLASFQYIVAQSSALANTVSVTVHPTIYARLTDETNTEWHQVTLDAAAKNIQFITI